MQFHPVDIDDIIPKFVLDVETECWIWSHLDQDGYGPYRKFYIEAKGPIEKGNHIHHTCMVRSCVNPEHLISVVREVHTALHHYPELLRKRSND